MRVLPNSAAGLRHQVAPLLLIALMCLPGGAPVHAAPPASSPPPAAVPDYGGRDSSPLAAVDTAPNPAAQAGRAVEALVVVLAGVVGVVYLLKRFGLVKPGVNGQAARITGPKFGRPPGDEETGVRVISSQTLPGGAMLHVVRVAEKTLLLAATPSAVTAVAEWPAAGAVPEPDSSGEFEGYLARAAPASAIADANARLRSLLSPSEPE